MLRKLKRRLKKAKVQPTLIAKEPEIWENLVSLNSGDDPDFTLLKPAAEYLETDARKHEWETLDYKEALARDQDPLPMIKDREGYYGEDHFSYWASGLADARYLVEAAEAHGVTIRKFLDLGCASGRVIRHLANEHPEMQVFGCDINRFHVEWCNAYLPPNVAAFHNTSIPGLPIEDNSLDMVSAFSVFTHIEAMETAWLMEIRRILKPGGLAWVTVHSEGTLRDMQEGWPLWKPVMDHYERPAKLDENREFVGDRMVLRNRADRSYSSNIFYKTDYLRKHWGRILDIKEVRRRFPNFQDVLILQKPE